MRIFGLSSFRSSHFHVIQTDQFRGETHVDYSAKPGGTLRIAKCFEQSIYAKLGGGSPPPEDESD